MFSFGFKPVNRRARNFTWSTSTGRHISSGPAGEDIPVLFRLLSVGAATAPPKRHVICLAIGCINQRALVAVRRALHIHRAYLDDKKAPGQASAFSARESSPCVVMRVFSCSPTTGGLDLGSGKVFLLGLISSWTGAGPSRGCSHPQPPPPPPSPLLLTLTSTATASIMQRALCTSRLWKRCPGPHVTG